MTKKETPKKLAYRMPAEWEKQEAVWLTWPKNKITWPNVIPQVEKTYIEMIDVISSYQKVRLLVDNEMEEIRIRSILDSAKVDNSNIEFFKIKTEDSWIRDYGPTFVIKDKSLAMINWKFNSWGNKYEDLSRDRVIPKKINEHLNILSFEPDIFLEGGSIEVDGKGTVLVTNECLLNKNRNENITKEEIENILCEYLNVEKVIWLSAKIIGDDTDSHIDNIARFVAPSVVVTSYESDKSSINYSSLNENYNNLLKQKDAQDKKLDVYKLLMPRSTFNDKKELLPASYANFLITNEAILLPIYNCDRDKEALSLLKDLFNKKQVIGLNCDKMIWGLGSIHCLSQQQPAII